MIAVMAARRTSPTGPTTPAVGPALRPLPARSVVLSLLLGAHPPQLPVRELVRAAAYFDITEATLRVALTRLVAADDLHRVRGDYALSPRLLTRQHRQDDGLEPATQPWSGAWELGVIIAANRTAAERVEQRRELQDLRLAEIREGTWTRPANLRRRWPAHLNDLTQRFIAQPEANSVELVATLWDLPAWAATGHALLDALTAAQRPAERITVAAAIVRHMLTDPILPAPLLPVDWPAVELRAAYAAYRRELADFALAALGPRHGRPEPNL